MEHLHTALARLARPDDAGRLYRLEVRAASGAAGTDHESPGPLLVERWQGWETLAGDVAFWIDVLSTDATLPLDAWLGKAATLQTQLPSSATHARSGVVREAALLGSDGGLARYRLCLVPWTWLLTQGRHSRVFQERSVLDIAETVFAAYAPLAAWHWGDEVTAFLADARPRSYCVQYRETDAAFVTRLFAEEGLGWRIEQHAEATAGHRLVVFADSAAVPEDASSADGGVRFHRSDATEAADTVQALGRQQRIGASALTVLGDDYRSRQITAVSVPLAAMRDAHGPLEAFDPAGAYAFADSDDAARVARLMAEARESRRACWHGQGTVRTFGAGTWVRMTQLPQAPGGSPPPGELLLTGVHHHGVNNLPVDLRTSVEAHLGAAPALPPSGDDAGIDAALRLRAQAVGYANHFTAVPRDLPWRPVLTDDTGARRNPRPTAPGYQTALVVGGEGDASGHELHADALGRIRVRFHWQQGDAADDQRSCWLRVAQRYAGPGVGSQFLPRIGQEVLVAFLEGDIDRPVVVGALYNGQGEAGIAPTPGGQATESRLDAYAQARDHAPSAQANLAGGHAPVWHGHGGGDDAHRNAAALWGVQSKEWGGSGHNRLVFDDSDGQLRLQLATTHAHTQLNLGHLIHQADNYRGSFRGEGFELRTDAWGAVRAEAGLWLSAYRHGAATPAGDAVPPGALLTQLQSLGKTFSQAASTHQTVTLASHTGVTGTDESKLIADQAPLTALRASARTTVDAITLDAAQGDAKARAATPGDDRVPHTGDALLGLTAPAGIGLIAGQSLHWAVGETLTLASGQASHLAAAGHLRLHTGQAIGWLAGAVEGQTEDTTLSLVTAEGAMDLIAQNDQIKLQAKDQLKFVSAHAEVELAAGKTVHLATAGGASLTIEGGNIVIACPGTITVHAGKKSFLGPTQLSREMNSWPETKFDDLYVVRDEVTDAPLRNMPVELTRSDGAILRLTTDAQGRLPKQKGLSMENVMLRVLGRR